MILVSAVPEMGSGLYLRRGSQPWIAAQKGDGGQRCPGDFGVCWFYAWQRFQLKPTVLP
jgi:hypothetical protein